MRKVVTEVNKKGFWDMTKEEQEALLREAAKEEIAKHHATGNPTCHGDDKGVFWLYPDGRKEYVKLYPPGNDPLAWLLKKSEPWS